jgi:signal transduction histidine kinase
MFQPQPDLFKIVSHKLTQAHTAAEHLDAISDYARQQGAQIGMLLYAEPMQPYLTLTAVWSTEITTTELDMPIRITSSYSQLLKRIHDVASTPICSDDISQDSRFSEPDRVFLENFGIRSGMFLPLVSKGDWIGLVTFGWDHPCEFTDADVQISTTLIQYATPVIHASRLSEQMQKRILRAETLTRINSTLLQALDEAGIVNAMVEYVEPSGADNVWLAYSTTENPLDSASLQSAALWDRPGSLGQEDVAEVVVGNHPLEVAVGTYMQGAEEPLFFEDVTTDERLPAEARETWKSTGRKTRGAVFLPFMVAGRYQGELSISWFQPHVFSQDERYIFTQLLQTLPSIVATRRAYAAEQLARQENESLYRVSQLINEANTFTQIVEAAAQMDFAGGDFYLNVFENFNHATASYVETVATSRNQFLKQGMRLYLDQIPFLRSNPRPGVYVYEDIANHPELDDVTKHTMLSHGIRSNLRVGLLWEERILGTFGVDHDFPKKYNQRDKRIMAALGELISSAVERIRLQEETQRTTEESSLLYQLAERVNAARSFQDLMEAAAGAQPTCEGVYLNLCEHLDYDLASYFEVVAGANYPEGFGQLIGMRFTKADFPIIEVVRHERLVFLEDTETESRIDETTRANWRMLGTRAVTGVLFHRGERLAGWLLFNYSGPRHFTEREKRLALGIGDLVLAAAERILSQQAITVARQRAEILAHLNATFSKAGDETDILRAFVPYASSLGIYRMEMAYADSSQHEDRFAAYLIALWLHGDFTDFRQPGLQPRRITSDQYLFGPAWIPTPHQVMYVEDIMNEPRLPSDRREKLANQFGTRAGAIIPLIHAGEFQGLISMNWLEVHHFSEDERYIFEQLLQTLPALIATRRAYIAEQESTAENQLLYSVSKAINQATTTSEVLEAVRTCFRDLLQVTLLMWQNGDWVVEHDLEIVASSNPRYISGTSLSGSASTVEALAGREVRLEFYVSEAVDSPDISAHKNPFGYLTMATTNLIQNKQVVGAMIIGSYTPYKFTDQDIRLISNLADLTSTALERFRLRDETEQARRQAEILAMANGGLSLAADEQQILQVVSDVIAPDGMDLSLLTYIQSDQQMTTHSANIVAIRSITGQNVLPIDFLPVTSFREDVFPVLAFAQDAHSSPIFIDDTTLHTLTINLALGKFCALMEWGAMIVIMLRAGEQVLGMVTCVWKEPRKFEPSLRETVIALQPIIEAIVARRRAYLAEQQRAYQLETVATVSAAITSILREDELLATVIRMTRLSFKNQHLVIYLLQEDAQTLLQIQQPIEHDLNETETSSSGEPISISFTNERSLVAQAAREQRGMIVNDIANNEAYLLTPMIRNARSEMVVPMVVANRVIGVLAVQSREVNRFSESDIWVMSTLADLVAVAIQNARLYEQAQAVAAYEERNRLARELHDSVSQALYGIALGARTARKLLDLDPNRLAEPLDYVLSLAEAGLSEMRALIFDLRPNALAEEGLVAALGKQMAALQARHRIQMQTDFCEEPALPLTTKEALYWIAREALHNTVKHAQATEVNVRVEYETSTLLLEIRDNGAGFDPHKAYPGHLGLQSMRERTERLGGTLHLMSKQGQGTSVQVRVQMPSSKE